MLRVERQLQSDRVVVVADHVVVYRVPGGRVGE